MKGTTLAICLLTTAVAAEKTPSQFGVKSKVVGGRDWTPGRDYLPRSSAWELAADKFFAPLSRGGALGRNKEKEGASEEIIPPTRKRTITRKRRRRRRRIFQTAAVSGTFFLLAVYQLQQATKPQHKEWLIVERDYVGSMTISPQQQPSDDDQHYSSDPPLPSAPRYPRSTVAINNPDGASIPNEVFNLVKAIVGVGVLSLPAGVAAFGDAPMAIIPAVVLITIIGILSGYGFALIGKVCAYTGATSFRDAWTKSMGAETSWIPAWSTTLKTFLACLAFSMVLADTFSSLLGTERTTTLLGVTTCILLPLCLKKDLKSLAPFSLLGVCGMLYTAIAMAIRFLDGNYASGEGSVGLVAEVARHLKPSFGNKGASSVLSPNALILVCMLSTAYMAHFNAPKFYLELRDNTIPRFHQVVSYSFGISIFLMGFTTAVGYLTFGKACDGLVLNNYASSDTLVGLARVAVAISLVFSYPLAFTGCRDGFLDLCNIQDRSASRLNTTTLLLLSVITILAMTLTDVSFVLAFGGATLGNALTYVYPALMYRAVVKEQGRDDEKLGVTISLMSAVLGILMGGVGAKMAIASLKS